jgi:hypothetical protein
MSHGISPWTLSGRVKKSAVEYNNFLDKYRAENGKSLLRKNIIKTAKSEIK